MVSPPSLSTKLVRVFWALVMSPLVGGIAAYYVNNGLADAEKHGHNIGGLGRWALSVPLPNWIIAICLVVGLAYVVWPRPREQAAPPRSAMGGTLIPATLADADHVIKSQNEEIAKLTRQRDEAQLEAAAARTQPSAGPPYVQQELERDPLDPMRALGYDKRLVTVPNPAYVGAKQVEDAHKERDAAKARLSDCEKQRDEALTQIAALRQRPDPLSLKSRWQRLRARWLEFIDSREMEAPEQGALAAEIGAWKGRTAVRYLAVFSEEVIAIRNLLREKGLSDSRSEGDIKVLVLPKRMRNVMDSIDKMVERLRDDE